MTPDAAPQADRAPDRPPVASKVAAIPRQGLSWLRRDEGWAADEGARRLGVAIVLAVGAVALKYLVVHGLGGELGYLSYVGAVVLGAWIAGLRGGLVTTTICAVGQVVLFVETDPEGIAGSAVVLQWLRVGLFVFDGVLVSLITSGLRRALVRERDARNERESLLVDETAAHATAERARHDLQRLQAVTASLAGARTPAEVADAILDRGLAALEADAGGVSRLSEDGSGLILIAARGYPGSDAASGTRFELDRPSHLRDAVVDGRPIFIGNPEEWLARYPASPPLPLGSAGAGGAIALIPLISSGRVLGSVVFRFVAERDFTDGTTDLAVRLAEQGAQALDRALAYEKELSARIAVDEFKSTVDASADAVYMFDPTTLALTYVNRGGADLAGVAADSLVGSSVLRIQPDDAPPAFRDRLRDVEASPSRTATYTGTLVRSDGRRVPVEALLQVISLPDGGSTAALTARDVTERIDVQARLTRIAGDERRQAAEFRAVIQAMGEGVLVVDPAGRIGLANDAAADLLGELPDDLAALSAQLGGVDLGAAVRPASEPGEDDAEPLVAGLPDGRWVEVATYPAELGSRLEGGIPSTIVVLRDVTKARDADAAREAFLGVLSHELRTPVTAIFGYAKVLQRPTQRDDQAELLSDIEVEADRLYRIVEDLLALSRVEGGLTIEGEPLLIQHLAG
ncbi:MAG TPA: histidine kinase dimerization/phospho-acceptor domain-containing protein, partial [Patescibacteria group bacterium]|nr:histidine kinase dimerization/phospho-acceptor domain-containing protein [Patescibacteria group bacterium]